MSSQQSELKIYLQGVLGELEKLSSQIRQNSDLSESAELLLCLKEMVQEQIESQYRENSCNTTHAAG